MGQVQASLTRLDRTCRRAGRTQLSGPSVAACEPSQAGWEHTRPHSLDLERDHPHGPGAVSRWAGRRAARDRRPARRGASILQGRPENGERRANGKAGDAASMARLLGARSGAARSSAMQRAAPGRIIGIGRNYGEHAREVGGPRQEAPRVFFKAGGSTSCRRTRPVTRRGGFRARRCRPEPSARRTQLQVRQGTLRGRHDRHHVRPGLPARSASTSASISASTSA